MTMERLARYLTKKGASVDSSIQWNSKQSLGKRPLEIDIFESCNRLTESYYCTRADDDRPAHNHEEDLLLSLVSERRQHSSRDVERMDLFSRMPTHQDPAHRDTDFALNHGGDDSSTVGSFYDSPGEVGISGLNSNPCHNRPTRECDAGDCSNSGSLINASGEVGLSGQDSNPCHHRPNLHTVHWAEGTGHPRADSGPTKICDDPSDFVSPPSSCDFSSINSILSSIQSRRHSWPHSSSSLQLRTQLLPEATVLLIDIKGFTAQCAAMPAARVGEWVAAFYK